MGLQLLSFEIQEKALLIPMVVGDGMLGDDLLAWTPERCYDCCAT
jgi:hypothetical protein